MTMYRVILVVELEADSAQEAAGIAEQNPNLAGRTPSGKSRFRGSKLGRRL